MKKLLKKKELLYLFSCIVIACVLVFGLTGCATFDAKMNEMKMNNVAPWADDYDMIKPPVFISGLLVYV